MRGPARPRPTCSPACSPSALDRGGRRRRTRASASARLHYRRHRHQVPHASTCSRTGTCGGVAGSCRTAVQVWLYNEALGRIAGLPAAGVVPAGPQLDSAGTNAGRAASIDSPGWTTTATSRAGRPRSPTSRLRPSRGFGGCGPRAPRWRFCPARRSPSSTRTRGTARTRRGTPRRREIAAALERADPAARDEPGRRTAAHANGIRRWDDARRLGGGARRRQRRPSPPALRCRARGEQEPGASTVAAGADRRRGPSLAQAATGRVLRGLRDGDPRSTTTSPRLPAPGGQALIAQIGCGHVTADGRWAVRAVDRRRAGAR